MAAQANDGTRLASVGAEIDVVLEQVNGKGYWQASFGGLLTGEHIPLLQGKILTSLTAPEAVLSEIVRGNKTSEIQTLDLVGFDRVRLSAEGHTGYTEVLEVATLTPETLATALGALPAVGASSNVLVKYD